MAISKLTARKVSTAKPGKYEDGGGLRLVVSKTGSKRWVQRYTFNGKRREMGLGSYPTVSLEKARDDALSNKKLLKKNIDPIEHQKQEEAVTPTFTTCAARYIRAHRRGWKNSKHRFQWVRTLKTYVRPEIGHKTVDTVTTEDILAILTPIWNSKTETAKRVQGRIENVLDYAAAHKYRDPLNPARWRGHLDKLLPKPSKVAMVKNHPAMPYTDVAAFMQELATKQTIASSALRFLILTSTRSGEVLNALWSEIDLEAAIWSIPADRMKAGNEHRVPLSTEAMEILNALPRLTGNPHVFVGSRTGKALSNMALLKVMRDMGYGVNGDRGPYVPHGFRSSFRDWSGEVSSYPRDVCEMALAHTIENKVEAAYRRGDLFAKRQKMMQDWCDFVTKKAAGIVQLQKEVNHDR